MLEKVIALDKKVLVFLNGLGSSEYDAFWLIITKQLNWTPLFLLIFYLMYKKLGLKNFLISIVFIAFLILLCDQSANFFKNTVQRLRPCNDLEIKDIIRVVKSSATFSYFSGHATNSMATTVFVYLLLKKHYKHAYLLFLFPLIFAYSRIYLGLHFPVDILTGYTFGGTLGYVFYKIYQRKIL
jgi:undecaprenyl-diphosphatase